MRHFISLGAGVQSSTMKGRTGIELIANERKRQIGEEKWSLKHDEQHVFCQMLAAAAIYMTLAEFITVYRRTDGEKYFNGQPPRSTWYWPKGFSWKPDYKDPIRNLVRAGALIAAEIDRVLRCHRPLP